MNRVKTRKSRDYDGFTLLELLVSMAILGILMLAFTQIFGGSLKASSEINARNELLSEGQVAQQLIASRLQNAYYLYTGTLQLTAGGATTKNTVRSGAGQNWTVGTDPFVAMLLPPTATGICQTGQTQFCFTFYAYYPMLRGELIKNVSAAPPADPNNETVWVLMEYRANIIDNVDRTSNQLKDPPLPGTTYGNAYYGGRSGQLLVDYVQPTTGNPTYTMFGVCKPSLSFAPPCPTRTTSSSPSQVDFDLRFLKNQGSKAISAPSSTAPLSTHIYPRNLQ